MLDTVFAKKINTVKIASGEKKYKLHYILFRFKILWIFQNLTFINDYNDVYI